MTNTLDIEKVSGIYKIVNKTNGKYYIGSSNNIHKRWRHHKDDLIKGNHHSQYLQRSWNKYGPDNFDFIIIETCVPEESLLIVEQKYLNTLEKEKCYNSSMIAGKIEMNKETRQKISESSKGKIISEETKEKLRQYNLGKKLSEETKRKISKNNAKNGLGKKWNHTEEAKQKISKKLKGKYIGPLASMFGKHHTEEWRKQMKERLKINHPRLDKTIYKFQNKITKEIFEGNRHDFYVKYDLFKQRSNIGNMLKNKRKSVGEWMLIK